MKAWRRTGRGRVASACGPAPVGIEGFNVEGDLLASWTDTTGGVVLEVGYEDCGAPGIPVQSVEVASGDEEYIFLAVGAGSYRVFLRNGSSPYSCNVYDPECQEFF